jgi:putative heme iron utilization protein
MSEVITPAVSDRICKHMNDDHPEAIVTYAEVYGHQQNVASARMLGIDSEGMDLLAQIDGAERAVRVVFDRPLADAKDAHVVLVEMLKRDR